MHKIFAAVIILFSFVVGSASAQQFWEKKDYRQWSRNDCRKLLEESPWSVKHEESVSSFSTTGRSGTGTTDGSVSEYYRYIMQLRSVMPVRQAVVRCAQFDNGYDKMPAEQKQMFDQRVAAFLAAPPADVILLHVMYESNKTDTDRKMFDFWLKQSLATLKDKVFLITPSGERIAPTKFSVLPDPGREFEFEFPRVVDGKPLITAGDKSLRFEMTIDRSAASTSTAGATGRSGRAAIGDNVTGTSIVSAEFKTPKMLYKGELVF